MRKAMFDLREKTGLTHRLIAEALGVDRTTVGKWENGQAFPRADLVPKLAKLYGCTIDQLYAAYAETQTTNNAAC